MKIGQPPTSQQKQMVNWFYIIAIVFGLGLFLGQQNVVPRLKQWTQGMMVSLGGNAADLPTLTLDISFSNYSQILEQRERALEAGVVLPNTNDFQNGDAQLNGTTTPIRLRLQVGDTHHLGDDAKWHFEGRTRGDTFLLGQERFWLVDPANHGWLNQWAFAQTLGRENVLATTIQPVRLVLNGADRGFYLFVGGFGDELMLDNGRTAGVIFEFQSDLLWQNAGIHQSLPAALNDPVTNLTPANYPYITVDAVKDGTIDLDLLRAGQRIAGISALRALQANQLPASAVFDVDKYAMFLALVDLWGATDTLTLTNLRYYYNPDTRLIEPIGFLANPLANASNRLPATATYNDPLLQAAYARALQQISDPTYLTNLQTELDPEWQSLANALISETGALSAPWEALAQRQATIRHSLNPPNPVFALHDASEPDFFALEIANVLQLPIEVVGFQINGGEILPAEASWVVAASLMANPLIMPAFSLNETSTAPTLSFTRYEIPLTVLPPLTGNEQVQVITRILGLDTTQVTGVTR